MKQIKINDKDYNVKVNFRSMMGVEKMTGKAFSLVTTTDIMYFAYNILLANNADFNSTFDEFIDLCDEQPDIFVQMTTIITDEMTGKSEKSTGKTSKKK